MDAKKTRPKDDRQRLDSLVKELSVKSGLSAVTYRRLIQDLERESEEFGLDSEGRLKVAFFASKPYDIESFTAENGGYFDFHFIGARLDEHSVKSLAGYKAVCIFVNDSVNESIAGSLYEHGVELVAVRAAGVNNIDVSACKALGISVVRVPAYSPHAIAEHTLALILTLNRHLHTSDVRVRSDNFSLSGLTGFDMYRKTVGVFGAGKIGERVIDIVSGFGCQVLVNSPHPPPKLVALPNVDFVSKTALLANSDIVTLHLPLTPETKYLMDESAFALMKPGAMFINVSRGALVDTKALIAGLKSGQIGSAGLDVYEEESGVFFEDKSDEILADDSLARLLHFGNVVVTAHQAFLTHEALAEIAKTTFYSLKEYEAGKSMSDLTHWVRG